MDIDDCDLINDIALVEQQLQKGTSFEANRKDTFKTGTAENEQQPAADFSSTIELNNSCQEVLKMIEIQLLAILSENQEKQTTLLKYLNESGKKPDFIHNNISGYTRYAGIPYFKDSSGYSQPRNDDVKEKVYKGELCIADYLTLPHFWTQHDKDCLTEAVTASLSHMNNSGDDDKRVEEAEIGVQTPPIDWLKISATNMNGRFSATECELQWNLNLDPKINKEKWSEYEVQQLNELAEIHKYQDWDTIAEKLSTNRTGYQCCIKYQMKNALKEGKWTEEENEYLKKLVEIHRMGSYVPWTKISWYFQTRNRKQCHDRYIEHLESDLKRGAFNKEEDKIIITGIKIFKDFGKIAKFLPGRRATQIRSRYYYLISTSGPDFTREDDEKLVALAKKYNKNWSKVSEHFNSHTKLQCRARFQALCKKNGKEMSLLLNSGNTKLGITPLPQGCGPGRRSQLNRKTGATSSAYDALLKFHEFCSENYFGPRIKNPATDDELKSECSKLKTLMSMFNMNGNFSNKSHIIESLTENCNFSNYDVKVLKKMAEEGEEEDESALKGVLIPPNYCTLTGFKVLGLARARIKNNTLEAEGLPQNTEYREDLEAEERLSFSRAQALFQSRMRSLFLLPTQLVAVPTSGMVEEFFRKGKQKKPKKLSRKRLKMHAKNMCLANQKKREKEKAEAQMKQNSQLE